MQNRNNWKLDGLKPNKTDCELENKLLYYHLLTPILYSSYSTGNYARYTLKENPS